MQCHCFSSCWASAQCCGPRQEHQGSCLQHHESHMYISGGESEGSRKPEQRHVPHLRSSGTAVVPSEAGQLRGAFRTSKELLRSQFRSIPVRRQERKKAKVGLCPCLLKGQKCRREGYCNYSHIPDLVTLIQEEASAKEGRKRELEQHLEELMARSPSSSEGNVFESIPVRVCS